jgi:hypothetical protein
MLQPLDGPSFQFSLSLNTTTVQELKAGASPFKERKVITVQPLYGKVYYYYGDGDTVPNAATVTADGFLLYSKQEKTIEASSTQPVYVVAESGTVDLRAVERA